MVLLENHALLLKTQTEQSVDKYETLLTSNNIGVKLVRTLGFEYRNLDILAKKLKKSEEYSGIIFSSPRCVQAVNLANSDLSLWALKHNFAVGEATAIEALEKLKFECIGPDSGNAVNLVKHILKDKSIYKNPFLYPHGNLKTDTLTKGLETEKISLDSVHVYDTIEHPDLEKEINISTNYKQEIPEFLVFFSPSGFHNSLKYLKNIRDFSKAKLIAIGPTTENAIKEVGLPVYGVAKNPTPESVLNILKK